MDTTVVVAAFGALFAIMNPFLQLPMFLALTQGYDPKKQRAAAVRTVAYSAALCLVVLLTGSSVLALFGIGVDDFRLAGGIVLLMIALGMLNGKTTSHSGSDDEQAHHGAAADQQADISFYPMAFPMIVGPGTITTIVLVGGHDAGSKAAVAVVLAVLLAVMFVVLWFAGTIGRHMSMTLRTIMTRLMGMILAAIAVQMVVAGLLHLLPGLAH